MRKTKLFLIRHGETEANQQMRYQGQTDSPLSDAGLKETEELSKALKQVPFSAIYCSPLSRSKDTAQAIASYHEDLRPTEEKDLIERDYGFFENKSFQELREKHSELYKSWIEHPAKTIIPEAETIEQLNQRAIAVIEKILKIHQDQTICVVGHGGINRCILFYFMGIGLDNFFRIKQDNCCINVVEFIQVPQVVLINSTFFLGEKRVTMEGKY